MSYEQFTGDGMILHIQNCDWCTFLQDAMHRPDCEECGHAWHGLDCPVEDRGDVADGRYKGGTVAIGPCPCGPGVCTFLTQAQVEAEQAAHFKDVADAAYDAYQDALYERSRGDEYDCHEQDTTTFEQAVDPRKGSE